VPIYGSVSTADIATSIKALLAHNDEAARITLSEENIKFVDIGDTDDPTKVKHLGDYNIAISLKGSTVSVSRKVHIVAQGDGEQ
jgi:ribosomal protein L9